MTILIFTSHNGHLFSLPKTVVSYQRFTKSPQQMTTTTFAEKTVQSHTVRQSAWTRVTLLIVLGYEAAGGLLGGALLVAAPDGRLMDMPVTMMHGAFPDFLIPGVILLGLGVLNAFAFVAVLRRSTRDWLMAGLGLGGFFVWFVVEIIILRELHWLHLMWGTPVLWGWIALIPLIVSRHPGAAMQRALLMCGVLSSVWYASINIYVPAQYEGYNLASFTVSELSAIDAPTRRLWVLLVLLYPLLLAAFGWGIRQMAGDDKRLRLVAGLIIAYCLFNIYWPPMHIRGMEPTLTDILHIAWAMTTVLLMIAMMGVGAAAFGKRFRLYTISSIGLHVLFGVLTAMQAPNIPRDGPTPTIGIWERINIAVFMLWVVVLAIVLLRREMLRHEKSYKHDQFLMDQPPI